MFRTASDCERLSHVQYDRPITVACSSGSMTKMLLEAITDADRFTRVSPQSISPCLKEEFLTRHKIDLDLN